MANELAGRDSLSDLRVRLDAVDTRLVALLAERGALIRQVIDVKRARGVGVVDRVREEAMFQRIAALASDHGLDPEVAREVLRAVIDAFTRVEAQQLGTD